jgi:hypothetical protein
MTEEEKGFTIKDRRMFTESNQAETAKEEKEGETEKEEKEVKEEKVDREAAEPREKAEKQAEKEADAAAADDMPLPEVNFPTFILSLNASALVHLGAIEDPASGKKVKNLPMAKQTIDILSMLEEKTSGNLNREEENILKNILYDLRIMYVKEKR